uniref:Uncharacterized protein n=1 Tax=Avena sativa TaxID=4498 RepID=A0ACD5ZQF3_AVESA
MQPMHKETMEAACHEDTSTPDGSATDESDPWDPPYPPFVPSDEADFCTNLTLAVKWLDDRDAALGAHRASSIIFPDRTPKLVNIVFHDTLHGLVPILAKDSVRRFLSLMERNGRGMRWGSIIIPEALNQMITQNAVGCVKVALEGQAPELGRCRAGPNCMTQYGYYPLHRAAEMFSVKMIKLLIHHGASANLRTAGAEVIEGILPLHVAVENTCMHKYLEDSLFPNHEHRDYSEADTNFIFKLIHLLCLPEMKIFLDTTRLIAKYTDNLLDELMNYIKEGRLAETAVLLLASQEQIRKQDGFDIICNLILDINITLESEKSQQTEASIKLNHTTLTLVRVISKAGESLDLYIRKHIEVPYFMQVPRVEVLERVSSILKDNGLSPPRECLEIGDLHPYEDVLSITDIPKNFGETATREALEMDYLCTVVGKAGKKRKPRRWELLFARRSFFPWWRSVLSARSPVKVIPTQWAGPTKDVDSGIASKKPTSELDREIALKKATAHGFTAPPLMSRVPQAVFNHQPCVLFSTAANYQPRRPFGAAVNYQPRRLFGTAALMLLKVLKRKA